MALRRNRKSMTRAGPDRPNRELVKRNKRAASIPDREPKGSLLLRYGFVTHWRPHARLPARPAPLTARFEKIPWQGDTGKRRI